MQNSVVGIDVSKLTLDLFIKPVNLACTVSNDVAGFEQMLAFFSQHSIDLSTVLVVVEHTGRYSAQLENFFHLKAIGVCKLPALEIKRSLGLTRGKNDKIDAARIAHYGWLRRATLHPDAVVDPIIVRLQSLLSLRTKLVRDKAGYLSRVKEMLATGASKQSMDIRLQVQLIAMFTKKIILLNNEIDRLIAENKALAETKALLESIKSIGPVIAAYMIACTHNFTRFKNARKFNCYAGLAPFHHQSGTSIRGKMRISRLANQDAKCLLTLAAYNAVRTNEEIKQYYKRRVDEGKTKASCINIVRAKLVARMFAVVQRHSQYIPVINAA